MILKELFNALVEETGGRRLAPGEPGRPVRGLAVDEGTEGWLGPDEVVVTSRREPDPRFLGGVAQEGAPGIVWRTEVEPPEASARQVARQAEELGLGLLVLPAGVPLRRILAPLVRGTEANAEASAEASAEDQRLLRYSHEAARTLTGGASGRSSVEELAGRLAGLLERPVVVEDSVGRLIAGGDPEGSSTEGSGSRALISALDERGLRASRGSGVEETRRERRDRYARLPGGFISVPVERWRAADAEFFWTPIGGAGPPAGYLWVDLAGGALRPEDVVTLYWSKRALEAELGKERVRLETELGVRGDFVDDLINGHHGSTELLLQRARYLGADLSDGALCVIVDIDDFAGYLGRRKLSESSIQELKRRLADAVRLQARGLFSNFLLGPRSDNVILFLGPSDGAPEDLTEKALDLASRVQRYAKGLLPDLTVSVGVGRFKTDPAVLSEAYSEAEVALEIGHRINGPSSVSTFEQTGTYKLLFRVLQEEPEEIEAFYAETLEPVVHYDSRYGTELVQTMTTYLANDASTARTAQDLFAHRHTIRYRLDRVKELTRLDVDKSEDRERLTLGIKSMQLLGRYPEKPSNFSDR